MNTIVFDIETIPDLENGAKLYKLSGIPENEAFSALETLRRQESNGSNFLPLYLHKIICISIVYRHDDKLKIWSLSMNHMNEKEIIERFYDGINKFTPTLVSWNGTGFDLPVLHYRSLLYGIQASRYWDMGDTDSNFKWNNYLNRYHVRHLDLMDILAAYQTRANAPLDGIAMLLGLPGKMGIQGKDVLKYYQQNDIQKICDYCETDVANTYLIYLRFELMRGKLEKTMYQTECEKLMHYLQQQNQHHFNEFLANWDYKRFSLISS